MTRPQPCTRIEPFTGKAARALTAYMKNTKADPAAQEKVNQAIRKSARRAVKGERGEERMLTYPKINTLYVRDQATFKVDPDRLRMPEVGLIKSWHVTEKIDGTSIRVVIRPGGVSAGMVAAGDIIPTEVQFLGRTDKAQTPKFLLDRLAEMFPTERCDAAFPDANLSEVILFGEGYGARIQKGGGNYRKDVSFRLFDVAVDRYGEGNYLWLEWPDVEDVARKLGIETVPVILPDATLHEAVDAVTDPSNVAYEEYCEGGVYRPGATHFIQEGIVARTVPLLFDRRGNRLTWKLKGKDFAQGPGM